jgi:hemoglobin/transferrin/lactoferrin receptor protein
LAAALLLAGASPAAAQTEELKSVTVTSTRLERGLSEIPLSVGVKTGEDIKRLPGLNLADYLADIPGVEVHDGGMPGGKRIMIRGESGQRNLILIDGVKISEQKSMDGAAILLDASQIERIEVIKGPASVLYGSEAIGGVLNIITKKGGDKILGFSFHTALDSSVRGLEARTALFGGHAGFYYRFTAGGVEAGNRRAPDGTIDSSSFRNRSFSGKMGYDWGGGEVWLKADSFRSTIHIPTVTDSGLVFASGSVMSNESAVTLDLPKWDRWSLAGGLELRNLTPHLDKIKFQAYYQGLEKDFRNNVYDHNWLNVQGPPFTGTIVVDVSVSPHTTNEQESYGGQLQTDWTFGDHHLIAGADFNRDELTALDEMSMFRLMAMPPLFVPSLTPSSYSYTYHASQDHIGVFLQDEWGIAPDLTATLGARETWVRSTLEDTGGNTALPPPGKTTDSRLVGNVGLVYSGFGDLAVRAVWSQGYRFPPLNALYFGTVHGSSTGTRPNPNLKPETSNSWELGVRHFAGGLTFDIGAFMTEAKNYITTRPEGAFNRYVNADRAETYGVELALSYDIPGTGLTPYTSATFLRRKITNTINATSRFRPTERVAYSTWDTGQPSLFGRTGLRYQSGFGDGAVFSSDLFVDWAVEARRYSYDGTYIHDVDGSGNVATFDYGFTTEKYPSWATLNLALGAEWGSRRRWSATFAVRNIFNEEYTVATNAVEEPGFHVVAGIGVEF